MDLCHDSDFNMHAGRESTLQDLKSRYHWEGVDNDLIKSDHSYLKHRLATALLGGVIRDTLSAYWPTGFVSTEANKRSILSICRCVASSFVMFVPASSPTVS